MSSNEDKIIEFGSRIKINGYYKKYRSGGKVRWNRITWHTTGIAIGRRTVYEGDIIYNWWDEQQGFVPTKNLRMILVVTSPNRNPIYCSRDQVELLTEEKL